MEKKKGAELPASADGAPKRRTVPQVPNQILHTAQMPAQQFLLLGRAQLDARLALPTPSLRPRFSALVAERAGQLAGTALEHGGHRVALPGARDGGGLGHQVEVEELDELELDLSGCGARLEEGRHSEQAVERFEGAGVARGVDEGDYQGEEGG